MGKVQDAARRLVGKVRPSMVLADQLRRPAQQQHQSSQLPTDPASLKTWLKTRLLAQDFVNTGSANSAKTLLRAIQHSNRTISTPTVRLQIMELYEKPFADAIQSLDTHYHYVDFPLQSDAEKSFQLAVTLCQEMAYGYKIALADRSDGHKKPGKAKRKLAVSRALEHLSKMVLRHSQVYRDWPNDVWRDASILVKIAINDRTANSGIAIQSKNPEPGHKLTILSQYTRLCALYLIDRKQYQSEQLHSLFTLLTSHANEIILHKTPQTDHCYSVGDDNPPVLNEFRYHQRSERLLYFSLHALPGKIDASDEHNAALNINGYLNAARRESRAPRACLITAESGLKEIHTLINLAPPSDATESQFTDIQQLLQLHDKPDTPPDPLITSDVFNSINTTDFGAAYHVENASVNGFGLRWNGNGPCRLQIGELLAHCYRGKNNETSWHLAVVRWINTGADGTLCLGVESITHHANAVDVTRLLKGEQQNETSTEGLLANYQPIDSKARMLILPMHKYRAGETVGYRDNKGFHMVKLIESVELSNNFQCFAISSVEDKVNSTGTSGLSDQPVEFQLAV